MELKVYKIKKRNADYSGIFSQQSMKLCIPINYFIGYDINRKTVVNNLLNSYIVLVWHTNLASFR